MSELSTKTIQDIIFDIHRRKSEYLFGYDANDTFHNEYEEFIECEKREVECPLYNMDNSAETLGNPMRFVQCYVKCNKEFRKYLKDNDFIVATPLFRVHTIENKDIIYKKHFWYPFRSKNAYLDIPPDTSSLKEIVNTTKDDGLSDLRWEITTQRDGYKLESENPFSIFEKVEQTKYTRDKRIKCIEVSDAYASFMMIYFIIARRHEAIYRYEASGKEVTYEDFDNEITWEFSGLNGPIENYIKKNPNNLLSLSIKENKVYRRSTWLQDLRLLGFVNHKNENTIKHGLFEIWLEKELGENNKMRPYKQKLKNYLIFRNTKRNENDRYLKVKFASRHYIKYKESTKKDFVLYPPIHLIVRAYWLTPVKWFFIPMTPKQNMRKVILVSGLILMIKDESNKNHYLCDTSDNDILNKVKNLFPILVSIYAIEKQSLEDFINGERIKVYSKQIDTSFRNAIAKVFLRTLSHNIGSHVLSRMIAFSDLDSASLLVNSEKDIEDACEQYRGLVKGNKALSSTVFDEIHTELSREIELETIIKALHTKYLGSFNSYIQTRMEFLADFVTGVPQLQITKFFVEEVLKTFDKNKYLLNRISGLSKDFEFKLKVELPEGADDVLLSIANDVLGQHALYIILENIIRNTAKHSWPSKTNNVCFTIKVEEATFDKSYYKIIVFDDVKRKRKKTYSLKEIKEEYTDEKIIKWFETYEKKDESGNWTITEPELLALELNALIDSDIISQENFELREEGMGMVEMLVCSAYLRRIPSNKVQNDKYRLIFDNTKLEEFNQQVKKGENSPKIFRAIPYNEKYLGFQFYLPKPKDLFIIDKEKDFINKLDLEELKRRGILIVSSYNDADSILHDICVINDTTHDYKNNLNLPIRRITWSEVKEFHLEYHERDLRYDDNNLILEVWRAYVSKLFKNKRLNSGNGPEKIRRNEEYPYYAYSFDDHGEEYNGVDFSEHIQIYGSQNKRIVNRITKDEDFENDDSIERDILVFKVLVASVTNVLILDERIQKLSESKVFRSITYHEFWNMMNVYIPQVGKEGEIDLNKKNYNKDYTQKIIELIKREFKDHEERICKGIDFIVIHLGVIEKMLMAEFRSPKKSQKEIFEKVEEIRKELNGVKVVITSGRGQSANLPDNIPFISYSMLSQNLIEKRFKLYLSELLYAAKPINR